MPFVPELPPGPEVFGELPHPAATRAMQRATAAQAQLRLRMPSHQNAPNPEAASTRRGSIRSGWPGQCVFTGPTALSAVVDTLTITATAPVPLTFAGFGITLQIEFVGAPLQAKLIAPEKPLLPVKLKLYVATCPGDMVADADDPPPADSVKFAG